MRLCENEERTKKFFAFALIVQVLENTGETDVVERNIEDGRVGNDLHLTNTTGDYGWDSDFDDGHET